MATGDPWYLPTPRAGNTPRPTAVPEYKDPNAAEAARAGNRDIADLIAGSQGRVDAARTAARSQLPTAADDSMQGASPYPKSNEAYSGMESTIGRRFANGYAPSAAEEAAAQAAQAAEIQRRRQGMQNEWLMRQGISPEALQQPKLGWVRNGPDSNTPSTSDLSGRPRNTLAGMAGAPPAVGPGMREYDYSGFAAPGTRIFAGRDNKGQLSITGAGLPSMESVGGGSGSHTQKVGAMLAQMSEKLAGMSGANDVRSMMERKSLRRSIAELSGVHNTLAGFEHGMASVGETTRGKKQSERATASAQAFALPTTSEQLIRLQAMREGPDTMREYAAAVHGGYAQPKTMPMSPLGMFTPGAMPTYYGSPEMGANIDAMNVYPYAR